jgi:hypothetical protein
MRDALTERAHPRAAADAPTLGKLTYSHEPARRITLSNELDACSIVRLMTP